MKVLMATDASRDANTAIVTALRLLQPKELFIDLLCVAPELVLEGTAGFRQSEEHRRTRDAYQKQATRDEKRVLLPTAKLSHREGLLRSNIALKVGSPAEIISSSASDYDLVVVGAHGKHQPTQLGLGPVATHLVENAHASVMVGP